MELILFDEKFDYLLLNNSLVDLVFDASGWKKIPYTKQKASTEEKLKIEIPNLNMNFNYAGVKKLPVPDADSNERISVTLKRHGTHHYPKFKGSCLSLQMMKLTRVPTSLYPTLLEFAAKADNNRFYIWRGKLVDEINELLILINLTAAEYNYFKKIVPHIEKLSAAFLEKVVGNQNLEEDLINFFKLCDSASGDRIYINPPFIYKPSINLRPLEKKILQQKNISNRRLSYFKATQK